MNDTNTKTTLQSALRENFAVRTNFESNHGYQPQPSAFQPITYFP